MSSKQNYNLFHLGEPLGFGSFVDVRQISQLPPGLAPDLQKKYPNRPFVIKEYREDSIEGENASYLFGSLEQDLTVRNKLVLLSERQKLIATHFIDIDGLVPDSQFYYHQESTIFEIQPKIDGVAFMDFIKSTDMQDQLALPEPQFIKLLERLDQFVQRAEQPLSQAYIPELFQAWIDLSGRDNLIITPQGDIRLVDTNTLCSPDMDKLVSDRVYRTTIANIGRIRSWLLAQYSLYSVQRCLIAKAS